MRPFVALFVFLLATSAFASPVLTIPLTKLQRNGPYLKGSTDADRARAAVLKRRKAGGQATVPATNLAYVQYTTRVGIGNPPTYYNLIVDTGSSNTICGTGIPYVRTSTSISTGKAVFIDYVEGNLYGPEYLDQVTLAPNFVITNQSIGDANTSSFLEGVDGIIGFGPVDLTQGTLFPDTNSLIPTVMNNLASQGLVKNQVLGIYFSPAVNDNDANGVLTYGGIDTSLYKGKLTYIPLTATQPASAFWGINITSATYGNLTIIPTSTAGIVDTGTTQVLLADDFFSTYLNAIPGAKLDSVTGLIEIPHSSVLTMRPLNFVIAGQVFTMDVDAQLIPQNQNRNWGGVANKWYGVVAKMGSNSGEEYDFVLGQKFMERYYTVFDADAHRVGFAETGYTFTTRKSGE